jgi:chromate transport protein ChrA
LAEARIYQLWWTDRTNCDHARRIGPEQFGTIPSIAAIFYGLKPAVLAIVVAAVIRIGCRALKNEAMWTLSATAFVAIFFLHLPFPLIISSATILRRIVQHDEDASTARVRVPPACTAVAHQNSSLQRHRLT